MNDEQKRQMVLDAWQKGNRAQLEISRDYANRQEEYTKEVREFLKFQLSVTPIIIGLILGLGFEKVTTNTTLSLAIFLLLIHFVWQLIEYFLIINYRPINLSKSYTQVTTKHKEMLKDEKSYLMGGKDITFKDIMDKWGVLVSEEDAKDPVRVIMSPRLIILQIIYVIAILLLADYLISWFDISALLGAGWKFFIQLFSHTKL